MSASRLGERQIIGRFFLRLQEIIANSWQDLISAYMPTDQEKEEYRFLGMAPPLREWVDGRKSVGLRDSGITVVNKRFEATMQIDVDELRRDKTTQIDARIGELAGRVAEHWAKLLSELIVTPGTGYDGVSFYSSSHVEGKSGTQDNDLVAGDVAALNVATPAAPTPDEFGTLFLGIIQKMLTYKDDQGEPMNAGASSFLAMVPPNMLFAAQKALTLPVIQGSGGAISNILPNVRGMSLDYVVNPRLAATDTIYVFRTDAPMKPLLRQEELFETAMDDDTFDNNALRFGVKALRNVGTLYWQYAAKAVLS